MLSLSSVSSTPTVVPRPALTGDSALRQTAVGRAIEPTTAISKERSRVESRVPEGVVMANAAAQMAAPSAMAVVQGGGGTFERARSTSPPAASTASTAPSAAAARTGAARSPQAEASPVQKAIDTQMKELFGAVWKASGKAVDFLLGRPEPTAAQVAASQEPMGAILWSLTAAPGSRFSSAELTVEPLPTPQQTPEQIGQMYSASGTSTGAAMRSPGQLLNVQA